MRNRLFKDKKTRFSLLFPAIIMLMVLIFSNFVSAGVITSLSKVDVSSNYEGIDGLGILGTWTSSPGATDTIIITKDSLPDGYDMSSSTYEIVFGSPNFVQVYEIFSQVPVYDAELISFSYDYNVPNLFTYNQACYSIMDDLYLENDLWDNTQFQYKATPLGCDGFFVRKRLSGYVGDVVKSNIDYSQKVNVGDDVLFLDTTAASSKITDSIDGKAYLTLTGFGNWLNSAPTDKNIYAYSTVANNKNSWNIYSDTSGLSNYEESSASISQYMSQTYTSLDAGKTYLSLAASRHNSNVDTIILKSKTTPESWNDAGIISEMTTSGNQVNLPLNDFNFQSYTATLQFLLDGDEVGLRRSVGLPKIVSFDQVVEFDELDNGYINYKVQNIGDYQGAFTLSASCDDDKVTIETHTFTLDSKETLEDELKITANSDLFVATQYLDDCVMYLKENSVQSSEVTASFDLVINAKSRCTSNSETAPILDKDNNQLIVNTLDSFCNVISSKYCSLDGNDFELINGKYECVKVSQESCGDNVCSLFETRSNCPRDCGTDDESSTNYGLMIFSFFVAFIVALLVFLGTGFIDNYFGRASFFVRIGLSIFSFIIIFILIPMVAAFILDLFAFRNINFI